MKSSSEIMQNLDITKLGEAIHEIIEIDEWLSQNPDNYARYSQNRFQAAKRIEDMQRWLDSSSKQSDNLEAANNYLAQLFDYTRFGLPLNEDDVYTLPQSFDNPLVLALNLGKMQIAEQLITMGAHLNQSILQFAIEKKNLDLLQLMISVITQKKTLAESDEMLVPFLEYHLHHSRNSKNRSMTDIILQSVGLTSIPRLVIYAIQENAPLDAIKALVAHYDMDILVFMQIDRDLANSGTPYDKALATFLKETAIILMVKFLKEDRKDRFFTTTEIAQQDVCDHILNTARNLPATQESIDQIKTDIAILNDEKSNMHIFLRGYVLSRLRNGLIKELENNLQSRTEMLARPAVKNNASSSSSSSSSTAKPVGYLKPTAKAIVRDNQWKAATLEIEEIANRSLDRFL